MSATPRDDADHVEDDPGEVEADQLAALRPELEADRAALHEQLARLDEDFAEESRNRPTSDDEVDAGSATSEWERTMSLARHARRQLQLIDAALARMDDGTYGRCTSCGAAIPAARLEARPQSALCLTCQRAVERGR